MTRRRIIAAGALVLVTIGVILVLVIRRHGRDDDGVIDGIAAVDRDLVVVWDNGQQSRVSRIDRAGHELWTSPMPAAAMSIGGTGGLTIVDGAAVVRYGHHTREHEFDAIDSAAIAYDLVDGHVRWDHVIAPYNPVRDEDLGTSRLESLPAYVSDFAVGKMLISVANTGPGKLVVVGADARTGVIAWTHPNPIDQEPRSPVVFAAAFALYDSGKVWMIDAATGITHVSKTIGMGCAIGSEYLAVEPIEPAGLRLVAYTAGTTLPRVIASPFMAIDAHSIVRGCGHHGDNFVFLTAPWGFSENPDERPVQVVVTDRTGVLLHHIELANGDEIMDNASTTDPAHASIGGELPRYVLFPENAHHGEDNDVTSLVMLDLETGTIAWRGKPDPALLHGRLFRAGTHWIWFDGEAVPTVAVFDGATGKLAGAVTAYSYNGVDDRSYGLPLHATAETLWVSSHDWSTPDQSPIAAIDLATMKPRFARTVRITDATAEVRAHLGIP